MCLGAGSPLRWRLSRLAGQCATPMLPSVVSRPCRRNRLPGCEKPTGSAEQPLLCRRGRPHLLFPRQLGRRQVVPQFYHLNFPLPPVPRLRRRHRPTPLELLTTSYLPRLHPRLPLPRRRRTLGRTRPSFRHYVGGGIHRPVSKPHRHAPLRRPTTPRRPLRHLLLPALLPVLLLHLPHWQHRRHRPHRRIRVQRSLPVRRCPLPLHRSRQAQHHHLPTLLLEPSRWYPSPWAPAGWG